MNCAPMFSTFDAANAGYYVEMELDRSNLPIIAYSSTTSLKVRVLSMLEVLGCVHYIQQPSSY